MGQEKDQDRKKEIDKASVSGNPGTQSSADIDILKQWLIGEEGSESERDKRSASSQVSRGEKQEGIASALLSDLAKTESGIDVGESQISGEIEVLKN